MLSNIAAAVSSALQPWMPTGDAASPVSHAPATHAPLRAALNCWPQWLVAGLALQAAAAQCADTTRQIVMVDFSTKSVTSRDIAAALTDAFPGLDVQIMQAPLARVGDQILEPYIFPRNVAVPGPGKMVMVTPETYLGRTPPEVGHGLLSIALLDHLQAHDIPYAEIHQAISLANTHYEPDLDLLVIAHSQSNAPDCASPFFTVDAACGDITDALVVAFGEPEHVIRVVSDLGPKGPTGVSECYDLDLYFHIATGRDGQKVALVYKPCLLERPDNAALMRDKALERLQTLGIALIELGREDFDNLAANAVSPRRGSILFPGTITPGLKEALQKSGITAIESQRFLGDGLGPSAQIEPFAVHCLTTEIMAPRRQLPQREEL